MDAHKRRARARAHVKHKGFCTCGMVVSGNGGKAGHTAKHDRLEDGHHYLTQDEWVRRFGALTSSKACQATS